MDTTDNTECVSMGIGDASSVTDVAATWGRVVIVEADADTKQVASMDTTDNAGGRFTGMKQATSSKADVALASGWGVVEARASLEE